LLETVIGLIKEASGYADVAGYGGLFLVMLIEGTGLPLPFPAGALLMVIGANVAVGGLNLGLALMTSTLGFTSGATLLFYFVAQGDTWLRRLLSAGVSLNNGGVKNRSVRQAWEWYQRHGALMSLIGRVIPGLRIYITVPAALSRPRVSDFVACTFLGALAWNTVVIGLGMLAGRQWGRVSALLDPTDPWLILAALVGSGALVAYRLWRHR